jgi:hypothetical protein
MADENVTQEGYAEPIIIDLGKKKRKHVRKLRRGKGGRLLDKIHEILAHSIEAKAIPAGAQPVVVVVRERAQRRGSKIWGLG